MLTEELHCCCSNVTITLNPPSAGTTGTNALPDGSSNVIYSTTITAGGTDCPHYKFTVASGSALPLGLILTNLTDTSAAITGTPTTVGSNTFVITATETNGCSTNQLFSLALLAIPGPCPVCPVALATYSLAITIRIYRAPDNLSCAFDCPVDAPFVLGTGGYMEYAYIFPLTQISDCRWYGSPQDYGVYDGTGLTVNMYASATGVTTFGAAFECALVGGGITLRNDSGTPCTFVGSYGANDYGGMPTPCAFDGGKIMSAVISAAP